MDPSDSMNAVGGVGSKCLFHHCCISYVATFAMVATYGVMDWSNNERKALLRIWGAPEIKHLHRFFN